MSMKLRVKRLEAALRKRKNFSDNDLEKMAEYLCDNWLPNDPEANRLYDQWFAHAQEKGYNVDTLEGIIYYNTHDPVLIELEQKMDERMNAYIESLR